MSSMTMEQSEISCSPALTDAGLSEGTISSHNSDKNMCKYPEHSHMRSMIHGMQPVLSGGSNSDKSITYTGPFPDEDISGLHFSPKTTHPGEICASDRVQDFKKPLENKFAIKPVTFYNSLTEMSTNSDDCEMNKSLDSMETLTQITNLKNSLNDTDMCTSTTKMKSSGLWRKRSCMVNSYMFEAALDETSFDNTINESCSKFTLRRKKRLQANDNFSEAFNSQTMSECSKNNESMEDTIKERALGNTLTQNSLIEHNVKTRGFKIHKQSKHSERRFSEAFNNTENTEHDISQDIDNKIIKLSERSQTAESLQNCGNFFRAIRNSNQMVTSSIFQDVFNETDSSNAIVPKNIIMNNDLSNFLPSVCSGQKTQINEHLETGDNNILHKKKVTEEMFNSVHTTNTQNEMIECCKSFDHSDRRDLVSQSQTNFERECYNSIPGKTNLEENIISEVEENECCNKYSRLNENDEYNKAPHVTLNVSAAKRESEPFKKTDSLLLDSNEDNEICAKKLNAEMSQNKSIMVIHGNTRASLQNELCDKESKQNKLVKSVENFSKTDRTLDISGDMQDTSCSALQNIVCEKNDDIYKTFHNNYSEHVMNTLETKQNDQAHLDDSKHFKILDTIKNTINHNATDLASEPKHSLNKDSFCLKIQEKHSALANKICVHVSPDEGTHFKSATGDTHVIKKLLCNKTKQNSNLDESSNEVASHPHSEGRKQNVEDNRIFTDKNAESVKVRQPNNENIFMHSHTDQYVSNTLTNIENRECLTVSDNNSLVYFQSLVYEESEGKSHEEINNGTSALLEFDASRNLKFCSSTRSSVYSADRNLSKQNTDVSEAHPDFTRTQITGESSTALNSSSNSLISTADKDKSENSAEDIYKSIEMCALNNSLDTTLTENEDSICDVAHHTQDSSSLEISQNVLCIKSSELQGSKNNVTEQRFSKLSNEDTINKSKECQRNKENPSPAVQGCVSKPSLQESSSLQTQVDKHQSQTFITSTKTNSCVLTSLNSQKKRKHFENQENNNISKKISQPSKEIKSILSSINTEPSKNSNQSSWGSMASCQSTNKQNSEPHVSEDIMPSEILSENGSNTQNFVITSVNTSLSDCSHKTQLHSKVSNTSKSQVSRKKLKKHSENNQKQAGSTVKNTFSKNSGRSRNNFNKSINHSSKKILKQTGKLDDITVLTNSIKNLDVTENSTTNVEINKTLQHDESNDDNGYDVGYNTFASSNMDDTPCNDTVTNKRNHKRKLNALRKCLFNSSILQNENDVRKFSIPFSELHNQRNEKLLNKENAFEADNSFIDNKFSDGPNVIKNKNYTQLLTYGNWATKTTKDYLISKLKPRYGVKATWRCQKLVVFMAKKINETIKSKRNYNVPVGEIKLELARLNIIETNLDFYMFVLKHLRQYEPDFVFKSVPCIQTFGRPNLVHRPSSSHLKEKIL